jgi:hypothetical protein
MAQLIPEGSGTFYFYLKTSGAYTIKLFTAIIYGRKKFYTRGPWSHIQKTTVPL